ncbi:MAG: hypothetical protein ABIF71_14630 [Planctomycetota bacterium]
MEYLRFTDKELAALNPKGLGKLLLVRKETIFHKNIMRQATADRPAAEALFGELGVSWPDYLRFVTNRLRRVLKAPRVIANLYDAGQLVLFQTGDTLALLEGCPVPFMAVLDFDRTITNRSFLPQLKAVVERHTGTGQFWVCSAHGREDVIGQFLAKHKIPIRQTRIRATGSVEAKVRQMFTLARSSSRPLMLYFDDEEPMCKRALLMGYHAYLVRREGTQPLKAVGFDPVIIKCRFPDPGGKCFGTFWRQPGA